MRFVSSIMACVKECGLIEQNASKLFVKRHVGPGLWLFIVFMIGACLPPVVFRHAQPEGVQPLPAFEHGYRGKYLCESDSALVEIQSTCILKLKSSLVKLALRDILESDEIQWIDNALYIRKMDALFPVTVEGDSVSAQIPLRDTLFEISEDAVLKMFRGHSLLNFRINANTWDVWVLSMDENMDLRLAHAELPEHLDKLERITPVEKQVVEHGIHLRLSPTPMELREILHQKLIFQECDVFYRVAHVIEM